MNTALLATAKLVPVLLPPLSIRERVDSAMALQSTISTEDKNKNLSFPLTTTKYCKWGAGLPLRQDFVVSPRGAEGQVLCLCPLPLFRLYS